MIDRNGHLLLEHLERHGGWTPESADAQGVRPVVSTDEAETSLSYPSGGMEVLERDAEASWWIDHRARHVVAVLRQRGVDMLLDVGAGTGAMGGRLTAAGIDVLAIEPMRSGAMRIAARGHEVLHGTLRDAALPVSSVPAVALFDVIEHLADPASMLRDVHRVLQPDGVLIITVPAHPMLWGADDEYAGHHRRYTREALVATIEGCGFATLSVEHLFATLVVPAFLARAVPRWLGRRRGVASVERQLSKGLAPPAPIAWSIRRILALEDQWSRRHRLPVGLSLLGVFIPNVHDSGRTGAEPRAGSTR